ncbi:hypothetical protein H0264_27900 [Nocardia huaxiensis]|uniref:Uncharacterized protein n=1 Tax=Nocardia huaxiensis TaxID=2755382 RepID=A0A7D6V9R8_9NOCA|nr:hypothetical protein [Nocardia huaxiensis]QLY29102.1 hypothetical protein H0264_27900 [Nocardia huaxiensis]
MKPLDSGVIGVSTPSTPASGPLTTGPDLRAGGSNAFVDLQVGQLPEDMEPVEAPAFVLSRKEFEQNGSAIGGGMPTGLGGGNSDNTYAASVLDGAVTPVVSGANTVFAGATTALTNAQTAVTNAQTAVNNIPASLDAAQTALLQAASNGITIPTVSTESLDTALQSLGLSSVTDLTSLFTPFQEMLSSFGSGILSSINPATLLSQGSTIIQTALSTGSSVLSNFSSVWSGDSSTSAQTTGQQAVTTGETTAQNGLDLSSITEQAAAAVQTGNIQLTGIVQAFLAEAATLVPLAVTPVGQTALIASATTHLTEAATVVNTTRGTLAGYTGQVNTIISQLLGTNNISASEVSQALVSSGEDLLTGAQSLLSNTTDDTTTNTNNTNTGTNPVDTTTTTDDDTTAAGAGGGGGGGGGGGYGGGGLTSTPGGPGSSVPGGTLSGATSPFGAGTTAASSGMGTTGSGFMGSPAAGARGGAGGTDSEFARNVELVNEENTRELLGDVPKTVPDGVIGGRFASAGAPAEGTPENPPRT